MISHFCLLVLYKRDSTLHKTYISWLQSTSQKRPPKMRRLCCRLRDVAWDRLSDNRDVAKIRCGDLGKRATPSFPPFFASLFTARLHHLWAWNRLRTGSSRVRESTHRKLPRRSVPETSTFLMRIHFIQFLGYGMCISILSLKGLRMLCLSRYKTVNPIDLFHARDQWLWKFRGTKEGFFVRKCFNPHRIFLVRPHGRRFIVLHPNMAAVK